MTTLSISLPDEKAQQLKNKAEQHGLSLQDYLAAAVDDILVRKDQHFECVADRILNKNSELYKRLA